MGAGAQTLSLQEKEDGQRPPLILGLQPSALVDHVARVDWSLLDQIPGDRGGSQQVSFRDLEHILNEVNTHILPSPDDISPIRKMAGGSVANTIRGLSAGFGVSCGLIGACGDDEQGKLFVHNMSFNGVDLSRLRMKKGPTAQAKMDSFRLSSLEVCLGHYGIHQIDYLPHNLFAPCPLQETSASDPNCACLVDVDGNRTMRPCLSSAVKLQPADLINEDFSGSKWLALRYSFYNLDLINEAVRIAKQGGVFVSLDLASFEMVRNFRSPLLDLLETGNIDLCFANEDEARELLRGEPIADPEAALGFLGKHCQWAVVTLGSKGCVAKHGKQIVRVPAIAEAKATDATGAGDLFASGFLYGLVMGLSLEDCCTVGSCSGGTVVQNLGGEVRPDDWQWMYKQMQIKGLLVPDLYE